MQLRAVRIDCTDRRLSLARYPASTQKRNDNQLQLRGVGAIDLAGKMAARGKVRRLLGNAAERWGEINNPSDMSIFDANAWQSQY